MVWLLNEVDNEVKSVRGLSGTIYKYLHIKPIASRSAGYFLRLFCCRCKLIRQSLSQLGMPYLGKGRSDFTGFPFGVAGASFSGDFSLVRSNSDLTFSWLSFTTSSLLLLLTISSVLLWTSPSLCSSFFSSLTMPVSLTFVFAFLPFLFSFFSSSPLNASRSSIFSKLLQYEQRFSAVIQNEKF